MSKNTIQGKIVLIAGGAKNLGGLIARDLAKEGAAAIVVHYNSDATKNAAEETVIAVKQAGGQCLAIQADLTQIDECVRVFQETVDRFGPIDIAINTVGMVLKKPMLDTTEAEYDQMFAVNSKAAFFFLQEAGRHVKDGGKICTIVTSLLGAFTGLYATYAGSKAAVDHFTRAAAKEFGPRGISVTAIAPGPMDTPFFYGQETPEAVAYHQSASALGGLTDIKDIAPLVKFLVTDGWWITGQTIFANGGYTTR